MNPTERRLLLVRAGFTPVPLHGKIPPLQSWQTLADVTPEQIGMWAKSWPDARNTGALTARMPAFDVDIVNEDAARAVEDLVRERYADAGVLMTRIGRAPKRAFLFRADEVFDKIEVSLIDRGGKQGEKIEFLADGQQVVLFGVHPDTRRPYRWHGGKPGEIKLNDLPSIRQDEAQALIETAAELLVRDFGYQPAPTRRKRREGNGAAAAEAAAGDWQFLIDNIHAGRQLHDSLRDLAAKLIASGMSGGAAVNHLRALMEGSTAPHDDRWKERYSEIPRLVESAEALREAPAADAPNDDAELERLARLPLLDYERARKDAAKQLGMRSSMLDTAVKLKRTELGLDGDDGKQGHAIEFSEPEPWPAPVEGSALLDDIAAAIRNYVVMAEHEQHAVALWVAHTCLLDRAMITPRLGIRSPVKGCGKTTLLDVVAQLVFRPLPAANVSASAIFRVVEGHRPCLLIDEADSFFAGNEELRGILNSGHRLGGSVLRNVGDDHEPRAFSTFAACAIALIGQLPGTLADRSITINLTRRKSDEAVEPFRFDRVDHLVELRRKLMRWTADNAETIAATEPHMPAGLYNRLADNWRPLLAIATVAGGDWLALGHRAALAGAGADVDENSRLEVLLGDIRDIFDAVASDRMASTVLIEHLIDVVPRPWAEYGKSGKPITQNKLARLLKPLGIAPGQVRFGPKDTRKGYARSQFEEVFERYLPERGTSNRNTETNAANTGTSGTSQTETSNLDVSVGKSEKSNNDGLCFGVSVGKGGDPSLCAYCGRPGGDRHAWDNGTELVLHPGCEDPYIDKRMAEQGIDP